MAILEIYVIAALLTQSPLRVELQELASHPLKYSGRTVEVRGVLHTDDENAFLCSPTGDPSDLRDCYRLDIEYSDAMPKSDEKKLIRASRDRRHFFWVTIRGRFEASVTQVVGDVPIFARKVWMTAVSKVERAEPIRRQ